MEPPHNFETALETVVERYRTTELNERELPMHVSQVARELAQELFGGEEPALGPFNLEDFLREALVFFDCEIVPLEELAAKIFVPALLIGVDVVMGKEKQQILDARYDRIMADRQETAG